MDPRHELTVALTAPGIAASGIPSPFASTTARAEFCIPVSIETVSRFPGVSEGTWGEVSEGKAEGVEGEDGLKKCQAAKGYHSGVLSYDCILEFKSIII
ncbi:hypothetical protein TrCOL_g13367 [Triparma columacea]|uniref:Uncharacterized protein n=1 Tax=Triparma columacea TaxID=722753 RepID=A0A9W7L9I3_9STRA|nr:hypothetical protein TrCOL_g13367 [Triparma columacea]